jgi:hypothetical protein
MHCPLMPGHHCSHWHVLAHHAHASYTHTASYSVRRHLLLGISTNDCYGTRKRIMAYPQPFNARRIQRRRRTSMPKNCPETIQHSECMLDMHHSFISSPDIPFENSVIEGEYMLLHFIHFLHTFGLRGSVVILVIQTQ